MIKLPMNLSGVKESIIKHGLELQEEHGVYIAGGFARSVAFKNLNSSDVPNDLDLFKTTKGFNYIEQSQEDWDKEIGESHKEIISFVSEKLKSKPYIKNTPYGAWSETDKTVRFDILNYKFLTKIIKQREKDVQLIITNKADISIEEIISKFDFTICQVFLDFKQECAFATKETIRDIELKRLIYSETFKKELKEKSAGHLFSRLKKYYEKGYEITVDCLSDLLANNQEMYSNFDLNVWCELNEISLNEECQSILALHRF